MSLRCLRTSFVPSSWTFILLGLIQHLTPCFLACCTSWSIHTFKAHRTFIHAGGLTPLTLTLTLPRDAEFFTLTQPWYLQHGQLSRILHLPPCSLEDLKRNVCIANGGVCVGISPKLQQGKRHCFHVCLLQPLLLWWSTFSDLNWSSIPSQ